MAGRGERRAGSKLHTTEEEQGGEASRKQRLLRERLA